MKNSAFDRETHNVSFSGAIRSGYHSPARPQVVLDARFAAQQFGRGDSEEIELLERIADSNEKIAKKPATGLPVS